MTDQLSSDETPSATPPSATSSPDDRPASDRPPSDTPAADRLASIAPYKGLVPYSEKDAQFFFGREPEREIIISNLIASRLTLLYGASGVGKSSVLRAGVVNQLRQLARKNLTKRPDTPKFIVVAVGGWRDDPLAALVAGVEQAIAELMPALLPARSADDLTTPGAPPSLEAMLRSWTERTNSQLLIILDQFEEYFLYHGQEEGDGTFAVEFPRAVNNPDLRVNFLISIREDSITKLDRFKGRIPRLFENYLRINHLRRPAARDAIIKPLLQYNTQQAAAGEKVIDPKLFEQILAQGAAGRQIGIEPALVDAVLDQVQTGQVVIGDAGRGVVKAETTETQIETPFLQMVLTRLWDEEMRAGSRVLRLETLHRLGNAETIVRTHLDETMSALPAAEQEVAADVFHHLVTPSGTKIAHTVPDLAIYAGMTREQLAPVMEKLARYDIRILRGVAPPTDQPDEPRYEIYHDVLAAAILDWRQRYVTARNNAATEKRLAEDRARAEEKLALEAEERKKAERQLARERALGARLRWALVGLALLLLMMGGVTVFAFQQKWKADRQQEFAVEQRRKADEQTIIARHERANAERQRLAAVEAQGVAEASKTEAERQRGVAESQTALAEKAKGEALKQQGIAVQEAQKATAAEQQAQASLTAANAALAAKNVAERATREQEQLKELRAQIETANTQLQTDPAASLGKAGEALKALEGFSVKDTLLADNAEDLMRRSLMALSEAKTEVMLDQPGTVQSVNYSPDGRLLAAIDEEGSVKLWDAHNGSSIKPPPGLDRISKSLALNNDGSKLLAVTTGGISVWDAHPKPGATRQAQPTPLLNLKASREENLTGTFGADGKSVITVDKDENVKRWTIGSDTASELPHQKLQFRGHSAKPSVETIFSPDGKLALSYNQESAHVWEVNSDRAPLPLDAIDPPVEVSAFSRDGKFVVVGIKETAQVYDLEELRRQQEAQRTASETPDVQPTPGETPEPVDTMEMQPTPPRIINLDAPNKSALTRVVFNPKDSNSLLTLSSDGTLLLWDVSKHENFAVAPGQTENVYKAVFSPDGLYVLLLGVDGTVRAWNIKREMVYAVLRGHTGPVLDAAFNPADSQTLTTTSYDTTARIWKWQPETWRSAPLTLGENQGDVTAAFTTDGSRVLTLDGERARVWDARAGKVEQPSAEFEGYQTAFSPDGRFVAAASQESTSKVWNAATGQPVSTLKGFKTKVAAGVFSRDGRYVVTPGEEENTARVWDSATGDTLAVLRGHTGRVRSMDFSPDAKSIVTGSSDGTARVWRWQTGEGLARPVLLKVGTAVSQTVFSPDASLVVTSTPGNSLVKIWDADSGALVAMPKPRMRNAAITTVAISPDNTRVLTVDPYGAQLWSIAEATAEQRIIQKGMELVASKNPSGVSARPFAGGAFSPDGKLVATVGGNVVQVWDATATDAPRRVALSGKLSGGNRFKSIAFSRDGKYLAAGTASGQVQVWEAPTSTVGEEKTLEKPFAVLSGQGVSGSATPYLASFKVAFSDDGKLIFASNPERSNVWNWQSPAGHEKPFSLAGNFSLFSLDGRLVFTSREYNALRVQETAAPERKPIRLEDLSKVEKLAFSPDGRFVAVATEDGEGYVINLWDTSSGKKLPYSLPVYGNDEPLSLMLFSHDGRILAVPRGLIVLLYDVSTGNDLGFPHEDVHLGTITSVAFSLDDRYLITASEDKTALVWDVRNLNNAAALLRGHFGELTDAAFSPDGRYVVTASKDKTARIWELGKEHTATSLFVLKGHKGALSSAAFSPDGRFVITSAQDNTARLWDARTGHALAELIGQKGEVRSAQISSDGKHIVTASADGTVKLYDCQECGGREELVREAAAHLQKQTTPEKP